MKGLTARSRLIEKNRSLVSRSFRIGAIVVGVLIVVGMVLPRLVNVNGFSPKLESELSAVLGRQ